VVFRLEHVAGLLHLPQDAVLLFFFLNRRFRLNPNPASSVWHRSIREMPARQETRRPEVPSIHLDWRDAGYSPKASAAVRACRQCGVDVWQWHDSAAMAWYILETTRSEVALGTLAVLAAVPAMVLMIFGGVIIDREDRRRLVMLLDAGRAVVILTVAVARIHASRPDWQLYLMHMLVSAGFWMFWPSITALIQELTPDSEFVNANTFLMVGVQGGWLMAGSIVGFVYGHIGTGRCTPGRM